MSWSYPRPRKPSNPGAAAAAVPTYQLQKNNHEWCFVRKSAREESPCCELIIQRLVGKLADSQEKKCRRDRRAIAGGGWEKVGDGGERSTLERRAAAAADVDGVIGQLRQELVALGAAHHPYLLLLLRRRRRPVLRRRGGPLLLLVVAVHAQCRRSGPSLVPRGESLTAATSGTSLEGTGGARRGSERGAAEKEQSRSWAGAEERSSAQERPSRPGSKKMAGSVADREPRYGRGRCARAAGTTRRRENAGGMGEGPREGEEEVEEEEEGMLATVTRRRFFSSPSLSRARPGSGGRSAQHSKAKLGHVWLWPENVLMREKRCFDH